MSHKPSPRKTPLNIDQNRTRWANIDNGGESSSSSAKIDKGKRRRSGSKPMTGEDGQGCPSSPSTSGASASRPSASSPEPNCAICLGRIEDKSFANACFHSFCRTCLFEWAKVKAECPVCRQPFVKIIHNVRSMTDYDEYDVPVRMSPAYPPSSFLYFDAFTAAFNPLLPMGFNTSPASTHMRTRADGTYRIGITIRGQRNTRSAEVHRVLTRSIIPPHQSAMGMGIPGSYSNFPPASGTAEYRRYLYRYDLWAQSGSPRYRETSVDFFRKNPAMVHRLIPFLNRELLALLENPDDTERLITQVTSSMSNFTIRSRRFRRLIEPHMLRNTDHFIHEFYCFARSPHDLQAYDRSVLHVPKDRTAIFTTDPLVSTPLGIRYEVSESDEGTESDPGSDTSCIEIVDTSDDEVTPVQPSTVAADDLPETPSSGPSVDREIDVGLDPAINIDIVEDFDNPRPGPSGINTRNTTINIHCNPYYSDDSDIDVGSPRRIKTPTGGYKPKPVDGYDSDSSNDSVMIVGFRPPIHQRTPEVIDLSQEVLQFPETPEPDVDVNDVKDEKGNEEKLSLKRKASFDDAKLEQETSRGTSVKSPRASNFLSSVVVSKMNNDSSSSTGSGEKKPALRSVVVPSPTFIASLEDSSKSNSPRTSNYSPRRRSYDLRDPDDFKFRSAQLFDRSRPLTPGRDLDSDSD